MQCTYKFSFLVSIFIFNYCKSTYYLNLCCNKSIVGWLHFLGSVQGAICADFVANFCNNFSQPVTTWFVARQVWLVGRKLRNIAFHSFFSDSTSSPLVFPRNDVWGTSAEIPYWWHVTSQIWVDLLIGFLAREICYNQEEALPRSGWWRITSMEFLRSYLRGHFAEKEQDEWWRREMSAFFSGYKTSFTFSLPVLP